MTSLPTGQMREEDRNEEIIYEKKASGKKKKTSLRSSSNNPKDKTRTLDSDIETTKNGTGEPTSRTLHVAPEEDMHSSPVSTAIGIPSGEVYINMEASDSTLPPLLSSTSVTSEPQVCSPNETPQSTPVKSCSAESVSTPNSSTSESDMLTCSKEPNMPPPIPPFETADDLTLAGGTGSPPTVAKSTIVTVTSASVFSSSIPPMDLHSSSKDSEEQTNAVGLETGTTNSSTESCKTPVAPSSDVMITMVDDDEMKWPLLVSENESSSAEMIYVREESTTETKVAVDEKNGSSSDVLKTNDYEGAQCDNDDMAMRDSIDGGK